MENNSGWLVIGLVFIGLAIGAVMIGNSDSLTPAIAQAQVNNSVGASASVAIDIIFTLIWKAVVALVLLGLAWFGFTEGPKLYHDWKRRQHKWVSGPNANWQKSEPKAPHFTRNDLMFASLLNHGQATPTMLPQNPTAPAPEENDGLEIFQ